MEILLESAGSNAVGILKLWWILFAVSLFVFTTVSVFLIWGALRSNESKRPSNSTLFKFFASGITLTILLLVSLILASFYYSNDIFASSSLPAPIEVVGKRWWWEVIYFDEDGKVLFKTANEIRLPAGVPTRIRLSSDNVIHSLWVPELGKKVDLIPGQENSITLQPTREGVYRGVCAEYCGLQHTKMAFDVIVENESAYQAWLAHQVQEAKSPWDALSQRGAEVFTSTTCFACHTIRGLTSFRELGPDLTHLMSRRSLASATIPNNKGHLSGWVADPQGIKPGAIMPGLDISAEDFEALMHYLTGLE